MRWLSPPERVAELRLSDRYPRPTSTRKRRRLLISLSISRPMVSWRWLEAALHCLRPLQQFGDVETRELGYVFAVDEEMQGLFVEAVAVALGAHEPRVEFTAPFLGFGAGILTLLHLDVFHKSLVGEKIVGNLLCLRLYLQPLGRAVEYIGDGLLGEVFHRCAQGAAVLSRKWRPLARISLSFCICPGARWRRRGCSATGRGLILSRSTMLTVPRPLQCGHAPSGELNEKLCGARLAVAQSPWWGP